MALALGRGYLLCVRGHTAAIHVVGANAALLLGLTLLTFIVSFGNKVNIQQRMFIDSVIKDSQLDDEAQVQ
jgi:hypothetical protein